MGVKCLSINHYTEETQNGQEQVFAYYQEDISECEDCETDEYLTHDSNGWTVCRKCGLVMSENVFVDSYIKPQIKYKTPSWRKPKYYDHKFFELLNKDYPNTTHFNYTSNGSKNHELDGYYNRYKNEANKEELIVKNDCLELGRVVSCSIDTLGRSCYE
jgi:hypothetical protein